MSQIYDVVVIGAGSVGVPIAWALAEKKFKVAVVDAAASAGQGQNKAAIGGVRATHSDASKIWLCLESLEIFKNWEQIHGEDIGWRSGGYCFPCYSEKTEKDFRHLLGIQKSFGLNIDWVSPSTITSLIPGIETKGLRGGTFSPDDGYASPLLSCSAFYKYAKKLGVDFYFNEKVERFNKTTNAIESINTSHSEISAASFIIANGADARDLGASLGLDIPVYPDSHEAGITEPVKRFFEPMVVDIREDKDSKNYYFYQNEHGQVIFCISPEPVMPGKNRFSTSVFLPQVARRMISLFPRLANIKVRRTWRGLYPMTPDGSPIISEVKEFNNLRLAVGMCGQGYMLGPGIGRVFARWYSNELNDRDRKILEKLTLYGDFSKGVEELK